MKEQLFSGECPWPERVARRRASAARGSKSAWGATGAGSSKRIFLGAIMLHHTVILQISESTTPHIWPGGGFRYLQGREVVCEALLGSSIPYGKNFSHVIHLRNNYTPRSLSAASSHLLSGTNPMSTNRLSFPIASTAFPAIPFPYRQRTFTFDERIYLAHDRHRFLQR